MKAFRLKNEETFKEYAFVSYRRVTVVEFKRLASAPCERAEASSDLYIELTIAQETEEGNINFNEWETATVMLHVEDYGEYGPYVLYRDGEQYRTAIKNTIPVISRPRSG